MSNYQDVVIVGAGITGLVTAYQLTKQNIRLTILEQNTRVGGVINSSRVNGYLLEYGPNSFQESDEVNQLISELNLNAELVTANPKMPRYVYLNGKLQAVPLSPPALISSKLLSLSGKLRILAEPIISKPKEAKEESIASFVKRRLGPQVHDRLVAPFVSGIYAGNTEELSLAASFPTLATLENNYGSLLIGAIKTARNNKASGKKPIAKRLCSFADGLATLPQTLANYLKDSLKTSCEILSINVNKGNYIVKYKQNNVVTEIISKCVVLATPAYISAKWLSNIPALANELLAIKYAPIAVVHLSLPLEIDLNGFGFLVPRNQGIRLLGSIWNSSLFPNRSPNKEILLTNFIGGSHDEKAIELTDKELGQIVSQEIKSILNLKNTPKIINVYKYQKAIPQYTLGHLTRLSTIESELNSKPGLYLASNYLQGVSLGDCVSRAIKLAIAIKNFLT